MTCPHPLTAVVRDSAGVEVCGACSPDVTSRDSRREAPQRVWWARPAGYLVTPRSKP